MSEEQFTSLKEGLQLTSLVSSVRTLANKVSQFKGLDSESVTEIFLSIASLTPVFDSEDMIGEISEEISTIAYDKKYTDNKEKLKDRLHFLLINKQIYFASKTYHILREYGNVYIGSRVITDIRPVFDIDVEQTPKGGVIVHNLRIHYQADKESDHKDIFLALDSDDIASLKEALIRAEKKESSLKNLMKKADLTDLSE